MSHHLTKKASNPIQLTNTTAGQGVRQELQINKEEGIMKLVQNQLYIPH